ncbi:MAG: helicase HerA domain-containing protein [Candidatus Helarchaeota archaeon]
METEILKKIGTIEGKSTPHTVTINVIDPIIGRNDYLQVEHPSKKMYLLLIKEIWNEKNYISAVAETVGIAPKTPFIPKTDVYKATEQLINETLGIFTPEEKAVYFGKLKGYPYDVLLPLEKFGRVFITGKSGSGKSYTVGVFIEEFLKKGVPLIIFDRHGEYSSLKVQNTEGSEEFHVEPKSYAEQIIEFTDLNVNPGGDVPIEFIMTSNPKDLISNQQCTIVNLRGQNLEVQEALTEQILRKLYDASVKGEIQPYYCILDEAHLFASKKKTKVRETVKLFAQEGRKFGANLVIVTQKPQLLDTTVRAQAGTWIIHQLTDIRDIDITVKSSEGLSSDWNEDIGRLEPGEAVITGDVIKRTPLILRIRKRETLHGGSGFNPLDFVSKELKETMEARRKRLSEGRSSAQVEEAIRCFEALSEEGSDIKTENKAIQSKIKELESTIRQLRIENRELEKELKAERKLKHKAIRTAEKALGELKKRGNY